MASSIYMDIAKIHKHRVNVINHQVFYLPELKAKCLALIEKKHISNTKILQPLR